MTIRQSIIDAAKRKGVTRYALAKLTGIGESHLHRYWHGRVDMTSGLIDKLCDELGLSLQEGDDG